MIQQKAREWHFTKEEVRNALIDEVTETMADVGQWDLKPSDHFGLYLCLTFRTNETLDTGKSEANVSA